MDPFHERLAQVGLSVVSDYGFALAGGYAVQAAGMLDRPSEDVDLFTAWERRGEFEPALQAIIAGYEADGLQVEVDPKGRFADSFARLYVTDPASRQTSKVELGVDWRANEPVRMSVGPVLHPDDAVANKMCALWARGLARDFIDVDGAICSGQYDRERLLTLAAQADRGFDRRMFAETLRQAAILDRDDFAEYGVTGRDLDDLRERFADWRAELLGG